MCLSLVCLVPTANLIAWTLLAQDRYDYESQRNFMACMVVACNDPEQEVVCRRLDPGPPENEDNNKKE